MTWTKLDENFVDHPKIVGLSDSAGWLWVRCLAYANKYRTDGLVPRAYAERLARGRAKVIAELIGVRLWHDHSETHYRVHDFHDYQLSAAELDQISQQNREAGSKGGKRSAERRASVVASEVEAQRSTDAQANAQAKSKPEIRSRDPIPRSDQEMMIGAQHPRVATMEQLDAAVRDLGLGALGQREIARGKRLLDAGAIEPWEIAEHLPTAFSDKCNDPKYRVGFFLGCIENGRIAAAREAAKPQPPGAPPQRSGGANNAAVTDFVEGTRRHLERIRREAEQEAAQSGAEPLALPPPQEPDHG